MLKRTRKPKRSRDLNLLAASVVRAATEGEEELPKVDGKNPAAVLLGRLGGKKGGKARAEKLSAKERSRIAAKAARARWGKNPTDD